MLEGKRILVAGASGYLGGFAVREFKSRGCRVRALARSTRKLEHLGDSVDETVVGEVTDPAAIRGICDGVDLVFSSIGITRQKDGLTYMDVDYQGNLNLLREAQRAGAARFVYISVFNAGKMSDLQIVRAKVRFEEALQGSGQPFLIVRPNGFFSDMLDYLRMAGKGRGWIIGTGDYRINPIHGRDLARFCAEAVTRDEQVVEVGGPDILTHNQALALAFEIRQKPPKRYRIPIWFRDILLLGTRTLAPAGMRGPLEFFLTVLAMDMVAPAYGECHLKDFYLENMDGE